MGVHEGFVEAYEKLSFVEKIRFVKDVYCVTSSVERDIRYLEWDGYLGKSEKYCFKNGVGDYYVYVWKHAWGDPFYVGSGKGDRWLSKAPRCNDFFLHLDQADVVVYKLVRGLDVHLARSIEAYVSVSLVEAGYTLANGDNNTEYLSETARGRRVKKVSDFEKNPLVSSVQESVLRMLYDEPTCDYRITDGFIMRNGASYFSRKYMKKER